MKKLFLPSNVVYIFIISFIIIFSLGKTAVAEAEVKVDKDLSTTWAANINGPWIDFSPDASVKRIYSKYSVPVEFPDRRGIHKAQIIAEEKAKAEIIRFLKQDIASSRVVTEIQNDVNKAVQERETGTQAKIKKTDSRTVVENLTEINASFATGRLSGVIVLEQGYDDKAEEAWVVVGISDKTISAARNIENMISGQGKVEKSSKDKIWIQQSDVRKSEQKDF